MKILYHTVRIIDFYGDCLFTSERELKKNPSRVKAFRAASLRGWEYALAHPEEIIHIILTQYGCKKTREHLNFEARFLRQLILPDLIQIGHMNPGRWHHMAKTYIGLEMAGPDYSLIGFIYDPNPQPDYTWIRWAFGLAVFLSLLVGLSSILLMVHNKRLRVEVKQRILAEKALQESEAKYRSMMNAMKDPVYICSHDFNNALSVIISTTELVIDNVDPKGQLREDLDEILAASKRAADITRQLLAFARKQTIAPMVLDLNENVGTMLKMLRRLIGEDIDLAWLPGADLWSIKMDPSQINQILANLCVNARDVIEGVGKVTIESENVTLAKDYCADHTGFIPGEFVQLSVSDNGCGMDEKILDNIFEPFFTTKAVDKGTGLGLATVYGIVKQNNGFINVYSEPDKGTLIKIYLPRHDTKAVEILKKSTQEIPTSKGETVLVVEDDLSILKVMQKILKGLGYTVLTSSAPEKTMGIVKEYTGRIHLLITDVIMPKMNGRDLAEQLQTICPDLKCIFMSGYTANAIAQQSVLDKGVIFIQKPFSRRELAEIVRKVLDDSLKE